MYQEWSGVIYKLLPIPRLNLAVMRLKVNILIIDKLINMRSDRHCCYMLHVLRDGRYMGSNCCMSKHSKHTSKCWLRAFSDKLPITCAFHLNMWEGIARTQYRDIPSVSAMAPIGKLNHQPSSRSYNVLISYPIYPPGTSLTTYSE